MPTPTLSLRRFLVCLGLVAVFVSSSSPLQAALDMFLKIEAPELKGESLDKVFKDQIDVLAWSWGVSNSGSMQTGGAGGAGKANFQDLSITKYLDKSTTGLLLAAFTGKSFGKITLTIMKAGETRSRYLEIIMEQVMVTSVSTGGSGGEDRLTENVSFNFAKISVEYFVQDPKGVVTSGGKAAWDVAANVAQ